MRGSEKLLCKQLCKEPLVWGDLKRLPVMFEVMACCHYACTQPHLPVVSGFLDGTLQNIGQLVNDLLFMDALWFLLSFFFSSPNLSRRRLDDCHTSTHDVALVRI